MTAMYRHGQAVVLRMYESHGERSQVELTLPFEVGVAEESVRARSPKNANSSATPSACRCGCSTRLKPTPTANRQRMSQRNRRPPAAAGDPPATAPQTAAAVAAAGRADNRPARGSAAASADPERYLWVARGGPPLEPVLVYRYAPSRGAHVAADIIGDYQGYVQTDGYEAYDRPCSGPGIRHLGCRVGEVILSPPSQTRTCRITASGSSWPRFAGGSVAVNDFGWWQWMGLEQGVQAIPAERA